MGTSKKLRVIVFEDNQAVSDLFKKMLQGFGHHVLTFSDPTVFHVCRDPECEHHEDFPCADALIVDIMMPNMTGIEFLKLQRERGCKILPENKALMSAVTSSQQQAAVEEFGCHFFKKPFRLSEVKKWLEGCAERIT
jgi:CheY-like chemotaxis protein